MSVSVTREQLLTAAQGGDREAILALLAVAQPDLRRYAAFSCHSSDDIDDAVQEALWILYRRVGTIHTLTAFSGWLFAVVRRECIRRARRLPGIRTSLKSLENDWRLSSRPQLEIAMDVARGLQSLPGHYREIVLLRDVEELTIDEIAVALGRTREAVKANLHRARLLLREYLAS